MKCSICQGPIDVIGSWTQGHNAQPVSDGRCCSNCNATAVIPARLEEVFSRPKVTEVQFPPRKHG